MNVASDVASIERERTNVNGPICLDRIVGKSHATQLRDGNSQDGV